GELAPGKGYNPTRGAAVIDYAREVLDTAAPLATGSHKDATEYTAGSTLHITLKSGEQTKLKNPEQYLGYTGDPEHPTSVLLTNTGLHLEILIDRSGPIGQNDPAGINDILLESAVTTIMDLEDSVAAVDADDKALGYRNWQELMLGTLTEEVSKN